MNNVFSKIFKINPVNLENLFNTFTMFSTYLIKIVVRDKKNCIFVNSKEIGNEYNILG